MINRQVPSGCHAGAWHVNRATDTLVTSFKSKEGLLLPFDVANVTLCVNCNKFERNIEWHFLGIS